MSEQLWEQAISLCSTIMWFMPMYCIIYENYRIRSVEGCELNYLYMNLNGCVFYAIYCTMGYFFKDPAAGTVLFGDIFFSYQILVGISLIIYQTFIYPRKKNRLSGYTVIFCSTLWIILISQIVFLNFVSPSAKTDFWNPVSLFGYTKLIISMLKYSPPVYWNYKRKSTKGWSILRTLTDLGGGTFSLISGLISTSHGFNVTKIVLAVLTVGYNIIFIVQHCFLYRNRRQSEQLLQKLDLNQQQ